MIIQLLQVTSYWIHFHNKFQLQTESILKTPVIYFKNFLLKTY